MAVKLQERAELERYVGYSEICRIAGISRSSVERAWRGPWKPGQARLCPPTKIGHRAVWPVSAVKSWLDQSSKGVQADLDGAARPAGELPAELTADEFRQLETQELLQRVEYLQSLSTQEVASVAAVMFPQLRSLLKDCVNPDDPKGLRDILLNVSEAYRCFEQMTRDVSDQLLDLPERPSHCIAFSSFEQSRALIVAAWAFPSLRDALLATLPETPEAQALRVPQRLQELAAMALNDATWRQALNELEHRKTANRKG